jgi:hypothetical protein
MLFRACRRSALVLILLLLFAPVALRAAPVRGAEPAVTDERAGGGFFELVRSALAAVWETATLSRDNGSIFDPNGDHATGDNGSIMDPDGRR